MPKYAVMPQWRQRRTAIGKKISLESELLMESELLPATKPDISPPNSPTSTIASTVDLIPMPEMKPLPGAWMVVGKGGRPVKDSIMYDEPAPKLKKKKRNRTRKALSGEEESPLAMMAETPSSSKCMQTLEHSMMQRQKAAGKGKEVKFWIRFQQEKQTKNLVHNALLATLAAEGMLVGESEEALAKMSPPSPPKRRTDKGSSRGEKLRRQARFAAAAARCYPVEDMDWPMETAPRVKEDPKLKAADSRSRVRRPSTGEKSESSWTQASDSPTKMAEDGDSWTEPTKKGKAKAKRNSKNCTVQ